MTEKEFTRFVEETKGIVLSAVRRYLSCDLDHAIDDVVQEAYLRIYRNLHKINFTEESSRNNWIYTIAKNESLRMVEKSNRDSVKVKKFIESMEPGSEKVMDAMTEEIIIIREVISGLPEKYRMVFELLVLGFSEKQISEKLALKKGTIKSRIHRGRELINRTLSERGVSYEFE
ncbi:MAG TPA: RNA polymerase sigma factor [Spirochaetota bacterium]|nr:RNA polymerase sigma factor [Spirochaetota bacterium]HPJ38895.1 RNA polymerase sigma factor [Spirochaetota bacterium]HPQ52028.1 RNA polymerase sigma factor [Spirochaetota bacterium]